MYTSVAGIVCQCPNRLTVKCFSFFFGWAPSARVKPSIQITSVYNWLLFMSVKLIALRLTKAILVGITKGDFLFGFQ